MVQQKNRLYQKLKPWLAGILSIAIVAGTLCLSTDRAPMTSTAASTFEKKLAVATVEEFPASYQPYLNTLLESYPNAVFVRYDTEIDWDSCFQTDYLMYPSRNMVIDNATTPSSWKSTETGFFDWVNNEWIALGYVNTGDTKMVEASREVTAYYFDPRSYLDQKHVFAFETQGFDASSQTVEGVESVLKGTFMAGTKIKEYDAEGNPTGKSLTYAKALYNIGKKTDVSPYLIAARIRQEQGCIGDTPMISGTVSGYKGLYNYLDAEAFDSTDINEVVKFSLEEAKRGSDFDNDPDTPNISWISPYLAIWGGSIKLAGTYVKQGRNNLYLQKFDVVKRFTSSGYAYRDFYGYETYLIGGYSEGLSLYNSYVNNSLIELDENGVAHSDAAFVFEIPVYNNMPDLVELPTKDGNPNYKLSKIILGDGSYSIGSFKMDTTSYSAIVPYTCDNIDVTARVYADTSTVKLNGTKIGKVGTTKRVGNVALEVGTNTVKVQCIAENGDRRTYTLTIVRQEKTEEPVVATPMLSSKEYKVASKQISKIPVGTKAKTFLSNLTVTNGEVVLYDADEKKVSNSSVLATGMTLQLLNSKGEVEKTYSIVIYGDANGDGSISARDILTVKRHVLDIKKLSGANLSASDVNNDGDVTARDILAIKRDVLGITQIEQR